MRLRKPTRAIIDQVRTTREGNDAIIDYADAGIAGTRFTIGPDIATMTDREIVDVFNGILAAQERLLAAWDKTVTEEPPGEKQIDYHEDSGQWVPRGDVLRCIIDDGGPEGADEPVKPKFVENIPSVSGEISGVASATAPFIYFEDARFFGLVNGVGKVALTASRQ